ncbi:GntR family transcriptional regulator [Microbacterium sp. 18062]|uniref:GntR family transcriptional regulator n=1 Tax=Microbacterium sp. 18062 TaxID=2681410 RepID=UPI00135989BB|nr:GntR family transcriptional regulator [Microbacterium sp. 18062]
MSEATARDTVQRVLRERIVASELRPGAPLDEKSIAAELGVSRTPVREAIIRLGDEGLVRVYPRMGTFVTRISLERVSTSQFVREAIETASYREAAGRVEAGQRVVIDEILRAQRDAVVAGDTHEFLALDDEFHRTLMSVSGREAAWAQVSAAKVHMDRARTLSLPLPAVLERLLEEHTRIADGLSADDDSGLDALRHHLRAVFRDIGAIRAEHPDYFVDGAQPAPVRAVTTSLG